MRAAVVGHVEWIEFLRVESVPKPGEIVTLDCSRRKKRRKLFDRKPWENVVIELKLEQPIEETGADAKGKAPGVPVYELLGGPT